MPTFPASIFKVKDSVDKSDLCHKGAALAVKHNGSDTGLTGEAMLLNAREAWKCQGGPSGSPCALCKAEGYDVSTQKCKKMLQNHT